MIKLDQIKTGDTFSELSTYVVNDVKGQKIDFLHVESNSPVRIDFSYIQDCMVSGEQFDSTVTVGLQDKYHTAKTVEEAIKSGKFKNEEEFPQVGQVRLKGIQTIFKEIPFKHVFTAVYRKKGTELTEKQLATKKAKLVLDAVARLETIKKQKKGVLDASKEEFMKLLDTNIESYTPGEKRTFHGHKLGGGSATGFYSVKDLKFPDGVSADVTKNTRLLNINTLEELIVDGVKYILE